jgi:hypothetical protein
MPVEPVQKGMRSDFKVQPVKDRNWASKWGFETTSRHGRTSESIFFLLPAELRKFIMII